MGLALRYMKEGHCWRHQHPILLLQFHFPSVLLHQEKLLKVTETPGPLNSHRKPKRSSCILASDRLIVAMWGMNGDGSVLSLSLSLQC